jgi:aspartyl aminopeptidase
LVCNDHEEVGSSSTTGAAGIMLKSVLKRICGSGENYARAISQSFLISSDNSHAEHPNYPQVHDANHAPQLNAGPVIKLNSNQKYATTTETAAYFKQLCQKAKVPVQEFVSNNNSRCGSTIGPITSTVTSLKTVDIGLPMLAIHSIRELMGVKDALYLWRVLRAFY